MKKLIVVALALVIAATATVLPAGSAVWQLIGERSVTDRLDHDVIRVTRARGEWDSLLFVVRKKAVQFRGVKVVFANGTTQDLPLNRVIRAGGESQVFDLVGSNRSIQRIEMRYDAQSLGGKAVVKVFGKR
jgi:hypothetical protein